jgi:allantoicase
MSIEPAASPPPFVELVDLAAERLGGAVTYANDEFFAEKDNLLKPDKPVFIEGKYTDRGKWMDGWETRRRRTPGHDFCIVRLGLPGVIRGVNVDTSFFRGNFPESCSLEACAVTGHPDSDQLLGAQTKWVEILPRTLLRGDAHNLLPIAVEQRFTHLRLHIYPDGGVARLRVYGEVAPEPRRITAPEVDLVAVENGGRVIASSDMFFGARHNLIQPGRGINMGDGWETRRSRRPGPDWVIVRLMTQGLIERIEVETTHFKGNAPESCSLAICDTSDDAGLEALTAERSYSEILPRTKLQPHTRHVFEVEAAAQRPATHVRFCIFPDGGVSRLRLYGRTSEAGRAGLGMQRLNWLTADEAATTLRACCGSTAWVQGMMARRPLPSLSDLLQAAEEVWSGLSPKDYLEAFAAHPRIGENQPATAPASRQAARWSDDEQAGVHSANQDVQAGLLQGNRDYEARFGHIYIVCATGKSAPEMLALLQHRLANPPAVELAVAAEEQRKITRLRLHKLVSR